MSMLDGIMVNGKQIRVYRWRQPGTPYNNFGDEVSIPLLQALFGIAAIPSTMEEAELIGSGSILDSWLLRSGRSRWDGLRVLFPRGDLHVWGSGFILPNSVARWPQRLHFHAVRGTLTARRVNAQPTLGDPGILANLLLNRPTIKSAAVGLVPHHDDVDNRLFEDIPKHWQLIRPDAPVLDVLTSIASSELIVSSSLHGLITADSFGIPCVWARSDRELYGKSDFKFHDYASARGAPFNDPVAYDSVFKMSAEDVASLSTSPARSMEGWQRELIKAFPSSI